MTSLPAPRGDLSAALNDRLARPFESGGPPLKAAPASAEDRALSLWELHELSYRGFEGVDERHERDPELLSLRAELEDDLEARLRARWPGSPEVEFGSGFFDWLEEWQGPSLSRFVQTDADRSQVDRLLRVRSIYHLKEADPSAWVVPRLPVEAKAALAELQYDEYGAGDPTRLHSHLFARGLEVSGLRSDYGAYVDETPQVVLEQNNTVSMFGLQRRLRGAAVGHLAAFEATSSMPSRRMAQGLERLGYPAEMVGYYTEHVEADAVHEQVAVRRICGSLLRDEPALTDDVWFGAWASLHLEDLVTRHFLDEWQVDHG